MRDLSQIQSPPQPRRIRVGCAGWSIPRQHAALFGTGESVLARYASLFDCVEINSSFYRPHRRNTYERWAASVPADFRFSVKFPRAITHDARLKHVADPLDRFLDEVSGLGDKLGCLLLQCPPSLAFDAATVSTFLRMVRRRSAARLCCEPRHPGWFVPAADALLRRDGVARVASDPAAVPEAARPGGDLSWAYWRWHGSPRMYYSDYPEPVLDALAIDALQTAAGGGEAWVIFDNTAHGHATSNAAWLRRRVAPPSHD